MLRAWSATTLRLRVRMAVMVAAVLMLTGCGSGTGHAPNSPALTLSTTAVNFGNTTVGYSAAQQVMLSNSGNAPLMLSSMVLNDTKNFAMTSTCGTTLAVSSACSLSITFQPASLGSYTANVSFSDNVPGSAPVLALSGIGTTPAPQASLSVSALSFSGVIVGSVTAAQTVALANSGTAPLAVSSVVLSDPADFILNNTCPAILAINSSCTFSVAFQPAVSGAITGSVVVTDNNAGTAGSMQNISLSGRARFPIASIANFGDSITCGYYASPQDGTGYIYSNEGYAGLFDAALGTPARNFCRAGDQAADMTLLWAYANTTPKSNAHQLYTAMIGTNDAAVCGASAGCLYNYTQSLASALAWLALPDTDKVPVSSMTLSGIWVTEPDFGKGLRTSSAGASISFSVRQTVADRHLYLAYRTWDLPPSIAGSAAVTVDGVDAGTLVAYQPTGHSITTQNGTGGSIFLFTVPLGGAGQHQVTLTANGVNGATFSFLWAGVPSANYATVNGAPRVLLGGVPASASAALQANIATYNTAIQQLVQDFVADGLNIQIAPTATALDPNTDLTDIVHPNNSGHAKLAAAFESVL